MNPALQATDLSKRYGGHWALRECTLQLPAGRVAALVGPNGAGKTTLLHLSVGLNYPTTGSVSVFGCSPWGQASRILPRIGFVAQDRPLYKGFSVEEMLTVGRKLNPRWDDEGARARLRLVGVPLKRKIGRLSSGQRAQVALMMALAKRPDLLLLDEPVAALDPLARREFLQTLMDAVPEDGLTILLSSHIIGDLQRICDYLIILSDSRVQISGDIEQIIGRHKLLVGPRSDGRAIAHVHEVIETTHSERQTSLLVRMNGHIWDSSWEVRDLSLEEIILAYLRQPEKGGPNLPRESEHGVGVYS
jgi:ABC-2 type transport system ATP-binding protein